MKRYLLVLLAFGILVGRVPAEAQTVAHLAEVAGVSGYEDQVGEWLAKRLERFNPEVDNLGTVVVSVGSGAPHRLLVTSLDEPGYIVSAIRSDGFLRVQRLPQQQPHPWFDLLHAAQPILVLTRSGKLVPGVVAGLSTHLHRDRALLPGERTDTVERMYLDVGARTAEEVRELGIDLLDPVTLDKRVHGLGRGEWTAPFLSDRLGAAALVELLDGIEPTELAGRLTVAFVARRYLGHQGFDRLVRQVEADELLVLQRLERNQNRPGAGVFIAGFDDSSQEFTEELLALAREKQIPAQAASKEVAPRGRYTGALPLPTRTAVLAVPVQFPQTPVEVASEHDQAARVTLLREWLRLPASGGAPAPASLPGKAARPSTGRVESVLSELVDVYGVSGSEEQVAAAIKRLLPPWAQEWAFEDGAGNLLVPFGRKSERPSLLFVAHMDEIGWRVRAIRSDGRVELDRRGGFLEEYFLGHAVLLHTGNGAVPAVLELPQNYHSQPYEPDPGREHLAYTGAATRVEAEALGIRVGDSVSVPKSYRRLAGTRVSARSFDDRVGSTALVAALWEIDPRTVDREVIFVWAVEEEIGLEGAKHVAARAATEAGIPDYVFAVDTFVSADSPLESPRYAGARLGEGFAVRAVDSSNVAPRALVDRVVEMARANGIPVQYGVTSGGNDGVAFLPYGSLDIPIGWPLRYSHSAAEVADLKDVEALARMVAVLTRAF